MKLERGMMVAQLDPIWYVVVDIFYNEHSKSINLGCICDHANNRFIFGMDDISHYLSRKEIISSYWPKRIPNELVARKKPWDVIAEILLGREDERFSDYYGEEDV